jgi:hypothetical protein
MGMILKAQAAKEKINWTASKLKTSELGIYFTGRVFA